MSIDTCDILNKKWLRCRDCTNLVKDRTVKTTIYSTNTYQYSCEKLSNSAFDVIPNSIIENGGIFSECPFLSTEEKDLARYGTYLDFR